MSEFCVVDLKNNYKDMNFDELNDMAKNIIKFALEKDLAVFFNSYDYGAEIINDAKMRHFFLMSDSFLYKNCGFLDTTSYIWGKIEEFKKEFFEDFGFFTDLLNIIFSYNINNIDIYISEDGSVDSVEAFDILKTNQKDFLRDLFDSIIEYADLYAYGFPTVKFEVIKCET